MDDIQRTPEYTQFIRDLEIFLTQIGQLRRIPNHTTFEPTLGRQKLDLYRIYKYVTEAGGYQLLSEKKLWKKYVTDRFNFPNTCTNSTYVVKSTYYKYLYPLEWVKHWGKSIETLDMNEDPGESRNSSRNQSPLDTSAPGSENGVAPGRRNPKRLSSIVANTRLQEDAIQESKKPKIEPVLQKPQIPTSNDSSRMMPPPNAPLPANLTADQKHQIQLQQRYNYQKHLQALHYAPQVDDFQDEKYLQGGPKSRILLALESGLPNEQDWAFNKLIKLSYKFNNLNLGMFPGLFDILIEMSESFFSNLSLNTSPESYETTLSDGKEIPTLTLFTSRDKCLEHEKVMRVLHVFRNFSFLTQNAQFFSTQASVITMLAKGIALPSSSMYIEIKHYCLCIVENLCSFVSLRGVNDFFLTALRGIVVNENDRSLIIGALRCLVKFVAIPVNEKVFLELERVCDYKVEQQQKLQREVGVTPPKIITFIDRLYELLLVIKDEELVTIIMDYLYQYSCLGVDACTRLSQRHDAIPLLVKYVTYKPGHGPVPSESITNVKGALKGPVGLPINLPGVEYPEPEIPANMNMNGFIGGDLMGTFAKPAMTSQQQYQMLMHQNQQYHQLQTQLSQTSPLQPQFPPPQHLQQQQQMLLQKQQQARQQQLLRQQQQIKALQQRAKPLPAARPNKPKGKYVEDSDEEEEEEKEKEDKEEEDEDFEEEKKEDEDEAEYEPDTPEDEEEVAEPSFQRSQPSSQMISAQLQQQQLAQQRYLQQQQFYAQQRQIAQQQMLMAQTMAASKMAREAAAAKEASPKKEPEEKKGEVKKDEKVYCYWDSGTSKKEDEMEIDGCTASFLTPDELDTHVQTVHIAKSNTCKWRGCTVLPCTRDKQIIQHHFKTHYPLHVPVIPPSEKNKKNLENIKKYQEKLGKCVPQLSSGELGGVSLTACLLLRNLARRKKKEKKIGDGIDEMEKLENGVDDDEGNLFVDYEAEFMLLMASDGKYTRFVGQILGEI